MKSYFLDEFENVDQYRKFMRYMLLKSDSFSLIYFKYKENEKMKKNVKDIFNGLNEYKLYSKKVNKWPNTETYDNNHIYKYVMYSSNLKCLDILLRIEGIYGWDYPNAPMDLCFYKNGYCWLAITGHERMAYLYTDNMLEIEELKNLGAGLTYDSNETEIFYI